MSRTAQHSESERIAFRALEERPPILEAMHTLGLNDARLARAIGYSSEYLRAWRSGRKPIPHKIQAALILLVGRLTGAIGEKSQPQTKYARRAQTARDAAKLWNRLAVEELAAELATDDPFRDYPDLVTDAYELGNRALARLEKADAN